MRNNLAAARATLIAVVISSPVPALSQTPRDIANLVWQQNVPAYVSAAPTGTLGLPGPATAADLARVMEIDKLPAQVSNAPGSESVFGTAFAGQDLARLSGAAMPSGQSLFATTKREITVANGAHR
jgi:hypothetical protein